MKFNDILIIKRDYYCKGKAKLIFNPIHVWLVVIQRNVFNSDIMNH
jgi:hypothetical protein